MNFSKEDLQRRAGITNKRKLLSEGAYTGHEPFETLSPEVQDFSRALHSLIEEIEAVDYYNQRVDRTKDKELKGILEHNRDEEVEHAILILEKIRRINSVFDEKMKEYLFKKGEITDNKP